MTRALILLAILGAAHVAHADDPFTAATPVAHLDDLVWLATAACDQGDDVQQRQCRHVRDARARELAGHPLVITAGTVTVGDWSAAKKSAELTIAGCLACGDGLVVDGKHYWLVAGAPRAGDGAKPILSTAKPVATAELRDKLAARAAQARVELVVTLGGKWELGGKAGASVDVTAFRAYVPCDGEVLAALPAAAEGDKVAADPKACKK